MAELPSGTVTFLFTDLEGSTRLWEDHPDAMQAASARHDEILRDTVESHDGHVVKMTGDGVHAVFASARDALEAAVGVQLALGAETWGVPGALRVRMGLHTCEAVHRDGDYFGSDVNRAARLMATAHGGQVVLSASTQGLVRDAVSTPVDLMELGEHRLRDLTSPIRVYQVLHPDLPAQFPPLRSLEAFAGNLPVQLTSFVGREGDVRTVEQLVADHRLVTLTGVGGVGKTRLATQAAAEMLDQYRDGAWLVELASVDAPRVVDAIAGALRVDIAPGRAVERSLLDTLRAAELLLVIDNCEHVLREVRRIVGVILGEAPSVSVVATSREGLRVPGEQLFSVPSLDDNAAIRLFVERARAADAGFALRDRDEAAALRLCERLDGIPLAIELAAARVRMFSIDDLARRVDERFRLLTGGRGDVERHQTLRAAIDWSFDLLSPEEQVAFARLSVFSGGWTLEAAEGILGGDDLDPSEVLDLLAGLVDKSLIQVDRTHSRTRYDVMETIRQYAQERLVTSGDAEAMRGRHAQWYADFARAAGRGLYSPDEGEWSERLRDEVDNLQIAVGWAVAAGDTEMAMRIGASFPRQGSQRPLFGTALLAEHAMQVRGADSHPLRARVLAEAAWASVARGDDDTARTLLLDSIDAQRRGARYAAAAFTYMLRVTAWRDPSQVRRAFADEGLAMAEAASDVMGANGMRSATVVVALAEGRDAEALEYAERALADARALRQPTLEIAALYVNGLVHARTDPRRAITFLNESLGLARRMGVEGDEIGAYALLADLEARHGNPRRALEALRETALHSIRLPYSIIGSAFYTGTRVFSVVGRPDLVALCDGHCRMVGKPNIGMFGTSHDDDVEEARRALGDDEFQRHSDAGAAIAPEAFSEVILREIDALLAGDWSGDPETTRM